MSRLIRRFSDPIHPDHLELHRDWLCNHSPQRTAWSEEMIPLGRGAYLEEGLKFPVPTGHNWRVMLEEFDDPDGANKAAVRRAMASTLIQVRKATVAPRILSGKKKRSEAVEAGLRKTYKSQT